MAWNRVQSKASTVQGTAVSSATVTLTSTPTTGNKIIVGIILSESGTQTVSTVKDGNANSLTQAWTVLNSGNCRSQVYFYDVPASASSAITVTLSATGPEWAFLVQEVSGLLAGNTTACLDGTASTKTGSATPSGTTGYASTASNEYLTSFFGDFGNSNNVSLSGWTLDANSINANASCDCVIAYKNSSNGAESDSWTIGTGDQWAIGTVAFKLASVAFVANPATVVGQGSTPRALTGFASPPSVTQAMRRGGYY